MNSIRFFAIFRVLVLGATFGLAGCASLPHDVERHPSQAMQAPAGSPVTRLAADAGIPAGRSGVWPLPVSSFALDARISLIRAATGSLDLQYYLFGNDGVGHLVLDELGAAGRRGVRVRLLVDDFHTTGLDGALAALAAAPNVEVRLFNPFTWGRGSDASRLVAMLADFGRLNHRMHNKLFIADGAIALVGGRNLADEYFFRSREANFLDMDFAVTGAITKPLADVFDGYWNSELSYPAASILLPSGAPESAHGSGVAGKAPDIKDEVDSLGQPGMAAALRGTARAPFHTADVFVHADDPHKARRGAGERATSSVTAKFLEIAGSAKRELIVFNPYFVPGSRGMAQVRKLREQGVRVSVVTNSIHTSDEPLVSLAYMRYRPELLAAGVRMFELSDDGVKHEGRLSRRVSAAKAQLHAKLAFIDREAILAGSMNLDARSAFINTEIGVMIRNPQLAERLAKLWDVEQTPSVQEVRLKPEGAGLQWVTRGPQGESVADAPRDKHGDWLWNVRLFLQSLLVSEDDL